MSVATVSLPYIPQRTHPYLRPQEVLRPREHVVPLRNPQCPQLRAPNLFAREPHRLLLAQTRGIPPRPALAPLLHPVDPELARVTLRGTARRPLAGLGLEVHDVGAEAGRLLVVQQPARRREALRRPAVERAQVVVAQDVVRALADRPECGVVQVIKGQLELVRSDREEAGQETRQVLEVVAGAEVTVRVCDIEEVPCLGQV